jgi:hypothetical protein
MNRKKKNHQSNPFSENYSKDNIRNFNKTPSSGGVFCFYPIIEINMNQSAFEK